MAHMYLYQYWNQKGDGEEILPGFLKDQERRKGEEKMKVIVTTIPQTEPDKEAISQRRLAVRILASACDGARNIDGKGFSKFDAPIGHYLDRLEPGRWFWKDIYLADKLITKYQKQLLAEGFNVRMVKRGTGNGTMDLSVKKERKKPITRKEK